MDWKKFSISSIRKLMSDNSLKILSYLIIFILIAISFKVWAYSSQPSIISLGLNFFTDFIVMLITVVVFQNIIRIQNDKEMLPVKIAQYRDIQIFLSTLVSFWCMVYNNATDGNTPSSFIDLFSFESFEKMFTHLNMSAKPPVLWMETWWDYFKNQGDEITNCAEKILNRYNSNLDPQVLGYIHYSLNTNHLVNFIKKAFLIRKVDLSENTPRPYYLGAYFVKPTQTEFNAILNLINWCNHAYKYLNKKNKGYTLYKISLPNNLKLNNSSSFLTDEQIKEQDKIFIDWKNRNKK